MLTNFLRLRQIEIVGVDVYTVQKHLGHRRIETTLRYLRFVPDYAEQQAREAQEAEYSETQGLVLGRKAEKEWETLSNHPTRWSSPERR